jgi:hypothetical protein
MEPRSVEDVLREPPPASHGTYAWWVAPNAMPAVPSTPHPRLPLGLLYVGIAPKGPTSRSTLRSRLLKQHIGGNIGSSTFRLGLASLLWEAHGWRPTASGSGKPKLSPEDNALLTRWQRSFLQLSWCVGDCPWDYEAAVVALLKPPMNRAHNRDHEFYPDMGSARDRIREFARGVRSVDGAEYAPASSG